MPADDRNNKGSDIEITIEWLQSIGFVKNGTGRDACHYDYSSQGMTLTAVDKGAEGFKWAICDTYMDVVIIPGPETREDVIHLLWMILRVNVSDPVIANKDSGAGGEGG